jgi:hypothetical protein
MEISISHWGMFEMLYPPLFWIPDHHEREQDFFVR